MFLKIFKSLKLRIYNLISPLDFFKESFSESGEDIIISYLLDKKRINKISYLELGVFSPYNCNNTYKFYKEGSRGVLVEADSSKIETIKKDRPDDIVLNIGVGLEDDKYSDFYIFDSNALSTFDYNEALNRVEKGHKILEKKKIKTQTINKIISTYFNTYPDFLSIDIEGLDLAVLKTLDFDKFPIPIICAETCKYSKNHVKEKDDLIINFIKDRGYIIYADTYINTIFVNKDWFFKE